MLNSVDWDIESIRVISNLEGSEMVVYPDRLKLTGSGDIKINNVILSFVNGIMYWSNGAGNALLNRDLTVNFIEPDDIDDFDDIDESQTYVAPILRPTANLKEINSNDVKSTTKDYRADIRVNRNGKSTLIGKETIRVAREFPTFVIIENQFIVNNKVYKSYLTLREPKFNSLFRSLNNTDWKINKILIIGAGKEKDRNNPKNFPVDPSSYNDVGKITLTTSIEDITDRSLTDRSLFFEYEGGSKDPLTAIFADTKKYLSRLSAPILNSAGNFKYKGKQRYGRRDEEYYEVLESTLENEYEAQKRYPNTEILYITPYGPNGCILLNNSFYIRNNFYWATLILEPYNSKK